MDSKDLMTEFDIENYLNHAPVMMGVYDIQSGDYHFISKEVENILGFTQQEIINGGLSFVWSLVHPEDNERIQQENLKAMMFIEENDVDPRSYWQEFEYRIKNKDEKYQWVKTRGRAYSLCDKGEVKEIVNMTSLISLDQKHPKHQTNLADFDTISQLAGEICHELNNPLQSLNLLIEIMIKQEMDKIDSGEKIVDDTSVHLNALKSIFGKISKLRENLHRLSMK